MPVGPTSIFQQLETSSASVDAKTPALGSGVAHDSDSYTPIQTVGPTFWNVGFSKVMSGVDSTLFSTVQTGSGQAVSQAGGSLIITSGTTANSETILRSLPTFHGALNMQAFVQLSQRIANQNFVIELVDVIGDSLTYVMNSATSLTVTIPNNPFTAVNVGQGVYLGAIQGIATAIPGRYVIASVSGNNVTFTVAGFTATGGGTLSLFGWNSNHLIYTGTSATAVNWDTQRSGWNNGDVATTINSTAAPGHIVNLTQSDGRAILSDSLTTSLTGLELVQRGTRMKNVNEDDGTNYYLQIRVFNGTAAPASTTTLTIAQLQVENFTYQNTVISGVDPFGKSTGLPVEIIGATTVAVSGTVTANGGTPAAGTPISQASTASVVPVSLKASAGNLFSLSATNTTATAMWIHLYNVAAAPTMGTTATFFPIQVPANSLVHLEWGYIGLRFSTGIGFAITGGSTSLDNTAPVAGLTVVGTFV